MIIKLKSTFCAIMFLTGQRVHQHNKEPAAGIRYYVSCIHYLWPKMPGLPCIEPGFDFGLKLLIELNVKNCVKTVHASSL